MNRSWFKQRLNDIAALAILLILIAVTVWIRLWRQPGLDDWDVMTYYLPAYAFLGEHVRHFTVPGWNPHLFSGTPFAANPQSGWSYLPAMTFFALFSPMNAFRLLIGFHMLLGGVTTFVFARLLKIGALGGLAAAMVFTFGQNLGAATCCTNHLQLDAWIPLALIGVELASQSTSIRNRAIWLTTSAVAVSQIIAGWIGQGTYYALLLISAFLIFRAFRGLRPWRRRIALLAVDGLSIVLGGVALSAAGLAPRLEFAARTYVGTAAYQSEIIQPNKDWEWRRLLQMLISYQPTWRPYYQGAAVLVCVAASLIILRKSRVAIFFLTVTAVVVVLPMKPTPIHQLFYLLPRFRGLHLHDPGRTLAILPIGIATLTGLGIDALPVTLRRPRALLIPLAPVSLWLILLLIQPDGAGLVTGVTWTVFILGTTSLAFAAAVASGCLRIGPINARRAVLISQISLIALLFLDPTGVALVNAVMRANYTEATFTRVTSRSVLQTQSAATDPNGAGAFLQSLQARGQPFRYFGFVSPPAGNAGWQLHEHYMDASVLPLLANNRAMRLGLDDIQGYDPAHLTIYRDFFTKLNAFERDYHEELVYRRGLESPLLDLLNVRYVIVPLGLTTIDPARYREVYRDGAVRVLENLHALPRAWIVHTAQEVDSSLQNLGLLDNPAFDPRAVALLGRTPPALEPAAPDAAETASVAKYSDDEVTLSVHAESAGLLMLSEIYDPGWSVTVDSAPATVYRADSVLRAVAVSRGDHTVVFRYNPRSLRAGIAVSLAAAALVLAIFVIAAVGWARDRRRTVSRAGRDIAGGVNYH